MRHLLFSILIIQVLLGTCPSHIYAQSMKRKVVAARLLGVSNYTMLVNNNYDWQQHFDLLERHNLNFCRFFAIHQRAKEENGGGEFPWIRYADGRFDLTVLNPRYFEKLGSILNYAQTKGIVCMISLLEECGFEEDRQPRTRWSVNPFNIRNNVNGVGSADSSGVAFLHSQEFISLCKPYIKQFVETVKKYPLVIVEICNEPTGGYAWEESILFLIREYGFKGPCCSTYQELTDYHSMHIHKVKVSDLPQRTIVSNDGYRLSGKQGRKMAKNVFAAGGVGYEFWDEPLNRTYNLSDCKSFEIFAQINIMHRKTE